MKSPRDAKTFEQICELQSDGADVPDDFWCSIDEKTLSIYQQKLGERPTQKIVITRKAFNQIVDWYNTGSRRPAKRGPKAAQVSRLVNREKGK